MTNYYIEIPAIIFALINIYLLVRINILNWLFGIVSISLYIIIFFHTKLYADMLLQFVFLGFQFYGWHQWLYGGVRHTALTVHFTSHKQYYVLLTAFIILFCVLVLLLQRFTDSTTVYLDSFVTASSLVAQWMLCKKLLENWLLWIVSDVVAIMMYLSKSLYFTSLLYLVFIAFGVAGFYVWKKSASVRDLKA